METKNERIIPFVAVHPGSSLGAELEARGIKQKDFAKMIGMQATHLNAVIKGKRDITKELALKLEEHLGISYKTWIGLQDDYYYDMQAIAKRNKEEQQAIYEEQSFSSFLNTAILYKRLDIRCITAKDRLSKMRRMVGDACSEAAIDSQDEGFFKHSSKCQIDEKNMRTWIVLANMAARDVVLDTEYEKGNAHSSAVEIASMANKGLLTKKSIQDCLNGRGIGYCFVEKMEKAPIDAYCTIRYGRPVIVVTYRRDDIDSLAFTILHELCHIEHHLGDGCMGFISYDGYEESPYEKEANDYARDMLIPVSVWKSIMSVRPKSTYPHVIAKCIADEAEKYGVSKSIAVSRYKFESNVWNVKAYRSGKIN